MPQPKSARTFFSQIRDWLDAPRLIFILVVAALTLQIVVTLFTGTNKHVWDKLAILGGALLCYGLAYLPYKLIVAPLFKDPAPPPEEKLPAPICPHCGYDLRASLMRCPECGRDTPFKLWLDKNPIERTFFQTHPSAKMRDKPLDAIPSASHPLNSAAPQAPAPPAFSPNPQNGGPTTTI